MNYVVFVDSIRQVSSGTWRHRLFLYVFIKINIGGLYEKLVYRYRAMQKHNQNNLLTLNIFFFLYLYHKIYRTKNIIILKLTLNSLFPY